MSAARRRGQAGERVPGEAIFRLLLRLHPRAFRSRYGQDMVELFRDGWRRQAAAGGLGAKATFWLRTIGGALAGGLGQRRVGRPNGRITRTKGGSRTSGWSSDLRYALRYLRRRPGFVAVVALTLALGIGANTAVFSVLHAVLLAPLPYEDAGRLVRIYAADQGDTTREQGNYMTGAGAVDLRETLASVQGLAVVSNYRQFAADLTDGDRPERVNVLPVSADYFRVLAVEPMLGRPFSRDDEVPGARQAVVSARIWESYLGAEAGALGASLTLDGVRYSVLGVMPAGFEDPLQGHIDVFVAQNLVVGDTGGNNWDNHYLTVLARLAPGVSLEQLRSELDAAAIRHRELGAEDDEIYLAFPLRDDLVGSADRTLYVLMGAVGLVFLIACVNVAGLTLARGASRHRELAIRSALGSRRVRLVRQVLSESAILALAGGLAGLAVGRVVVEGLVAIAPADLPGLENVALSAPVFGFGMTASLAAALLFGLAPALHALRVDLVVALRDAGRSSSEGQARSRLRSALVVGEVALALVLLVGAGVLLKSFQRLRSVDLAIEPREVATFEVNLPSARYDAPSRARFHQAFQERIRGLPEVEAAGAVSWLPANGFYHGWGVQRLADDGSTTEFTGANQRVVEGDTFRALGIGLLRGRLFDDRDRPDAPRAYVVNRALARRLFPDTEAVGERLLIGPWDGEIIGVVEDVPITVRGGVVPKVYHAHAQFADNRNWFLVQVVKLRGPAPGFLQEARAILAAMDPDLVLHNPRALTDVLGGGLASERFAMVLLAAFAGVALLLATVGIYGVLAHAVGRRQHEIGVRIALGAGSRQVRGMVVGRGIRLTAAGVALGLAVAFGLTRWLQSLVFEVSVTDPVVLVVVSVVLLAAGGLASWVPAARATRVDPAAAFRAE